LPVSASAPLRHLLNASSDEHRLQIHCFSPSVCRDRGDLTRHSPASSLRPMREWLLFGFERREGSHTWPTTAHLSGDQSSLPPKRPGAEGRVSPPSAPSSRRISEQSGTPVVSFMTPLGPTHHRLTDPLSPSPSFRPQSRPGRPPLPPSPPPPMAHIHRFFCMIFIELYNHCPKECAVKG